MRRWVTVVVLGLVAVVAADQWSRAQVQGLLERTVADQLAATSSDVEVAGFLVLPQLLTGELRQVDLEVRDALVGEPGVRLATIDATLLGLAVPFPPPAELRRVAVDDGQVTITILPREVARILSGARPGWDVATTDEGLRASGDVQGVAVAVTADVAVVGAELRFTARDVEVGDLGLAAASTIAAAFEARVPLPELPDGLVVDEAEVRAIGLVLRGRVVDELSLR